MEAKKQKIVAEQREFDAAKARMAYDKGKMDSMRRQVGWVGLAWVWVCCDGC